VLSYEDASAPERRVRDAIIVTVPALALTLLGAQPSVVRVIGQASPDWPLMAAFYLAMKTRPWQAAAAAFAMGFMEDALTLAPEGLTPLALVAMTLAMSRVARLAHFHGYAQLATILVLAALVEELLVVPGLLSIMGHGRLLTGAIVAGQTQKALVTGLIGPVFFAVFDKILAALEPRR
jgi:rod shape-determining protein MreD